MDITIHQTYLAHNDPDASVASIATPSAYGHNQPGHAPSAIPRAT
jgi:hypothetical protein